MMQPELDEECGSEGVTSLSILVSARVKKKRKGEEEKANCSSLKEGTFLLR